MIQTMEDLLENESTGFGRAAIWARELTLLPANVLEQHVASFGRQGHITSTTIVSAIAFALLVPFIIILATDEISERLVNTRIFHSFLWNPSILIIWALVLPIASFILALLVYVLSIYRNSRQRVNVSLLSKKYWLPIFVMATSAAVILLVLFHDSVQCWVPDHLNSALQCTSKTLLGGDTN